MTRDYARREKLSDTQRNRLSAVKLTITVLIIVTFLTGLWFLVQQPKDQTISAEKETTTAVEPAKGPPVKLSDSSDRNKDRFDFYTLLPESEVTPPTVEAYKSTPKDVKRKTNVLLQAGSFRHLTDANRLRAQLILLNLPNVAAEKNTTSRGGVWYRVRIGPFSNRSILNKAEDILAQHSIESIRIKLD